MRIVTGDGRIALRKEPAQAFDLLIVDAFSSDAVPVHLLTREALQLYMEKLDAAGVVAFHISNRYLNLVPLLTDLARDAGLVSLVRYDVQSDAAVLVGKTSTQWVVMARSPKALGTLVDDPRWHAMPARATRLMWTDDFSNPLRLMRWLGN